MVCDFSIINILFIREIEIENQLHFNKILHSRVSHVSQPYGYD